MIIVLTKQLIDQSSNQLIKTVSMTLVLFFKSYRRFSVDFRFMLTEKNMSYYW